MPVPQTLDSRSQLPMVQLDLITPSAAAFSRDVEKKSDAMVQQRPKEISASNGLSASAETNGSTANQSKTSSLVDDADEDVSIMEHNQLRPAFPSDSTPSYVPDLGGPAVVMPSAPAPSPPGASAVLAPVSSANVAQDAPAAEFRQIAPDLYFNYDFGGSNSAV